MRFCRVALVIMLLSAGTLSCGSVAPKYQVQVLADKPLVYWRLDEATGTVALDSSGNGLSGAYDPSVALGQAGAMSGDNAASFANFAALVLPAAAALDLRTAVSVEAWVDLYVGYFAYANLRLGFARGVDSTAPSGVQTCTVLSSAF